MPFEIKPQQRTSTKTWALILSVYLVVSIAVLWLVPGWISDVSLSGLDAPATTTAVVAARTSAFQSTLLGLGGFLAVITLLITVQRDNTNRQRLDHERQKHDADVKAQRDQLNHLKKTQALEARKADNDRDATVTGRFTQAIAQLGDETSIAVRLGGIYSLQRLANDSAKDLETVVLVLAAFLRESAPERETGKPTFGAPPLATDLDAAGAVLGHLSHQRDEDALGLNLRGVDLHGSDLDGVNFKKATLATANLSKTDLTDANMWLARIHDANLRLCFLDGAQMENVRGERVDLSFTYMRGVKLSGGQLVRANLRSATLTNSQLKRTDFEGSDLRRAEFWGSDLTKANFRNTRLEGAQFENRGRSATGWTVEQLAAAGSWDEATAWPEGYSPGEPVKKYVGK
ncbi:pentapeptide repeat-containing protein [Pseudoclavibacter sp. Z016]|uniref:pentapeptide repeat-containing protein n=1 Tax=Pseudoclavibacter sp. Z016 TaxID=2080581 RepID=UPI000CE7281F|nr:pentapeptide repeat-containing protein [Pseudoclavibacter sp. Z016]PPF73381.1 hypothetical protein C5B99_15525 [Pseudoclavibacter sp. Z016]